MFAGRLVASADKKPGVRLAPALLVFVAVLAACAGGDDRAISESQLSQLVLKSADLPAVWTQFDGGKQVRADAPPGRRADPTRFDRRGGWKARFRRQGTPQTPGPLVIESRADLFSDAGGAKDDFELVEQDLEASLAGTARRLVDPDLGDQAAATELRQGSVRFYSVVWRHGNVIAAMLVNGFARSFTFADVVRLARKQELRIARAAAAGSGS